MDSELVHRAEQAMLGAMMMRPGLTADLPGAITPDRFTDPRHQAIAIALTGTAEAERGLLGWLRGWMMRFSRQARDAAAYMADLPAMCPDPGHMATYYRMLTSAKAERDVAMRAAGEQAGDGSQILRVASDRLGAMTGVREREPRPEEAARLARALSGKAQQITRQGPRQATAPGPRRTVQQAGPPRTGPGPAPQDSIQDLPSGGQRQGQPSHALRSAAVSPQPASSSPSAETTATAEADGATPLDRRRLQCLVLADLMRHPDQARYVTSWLAPEAFWPGKYRELYTLIAEFSHRRWDIDPLTLEWAAADRARRKPPDTGDGGYLRPETVRAIGSITASENTGVLVGRMLMAELACTTLIGPDWPAATIARLSARQERNTAEPEADAMEPAGTQAPSTDVTPATGGKPAADRAAGAESEKTGPVWVASAVPDWMASQARPAGHADATSAPRRAGALTDPPPGLRTGAPGPAPTI